MALHHQIINAITQGPAILSMERASWAESCLKAVAESTDVRLTDHALANVDQSRQFNMAADYNEDGFWPSDDDWLAAYRPYVVRDGVLYVPVRGVLINNFGYAFGDWVTGYNYIQRAVSRGLQDDKVQTVLLVCSTPGGAVSGCFDLAEYIFASRAVKPIESVAADYAMSAGYALAGAASKITVARTGMVGSIGVVTWHVSYQKMLDEMGIKFTAIHAGKHKVDGNSYEDLSPEVRDSIQKDIDSIYDLFVTFSAKCRGVSEQAIRDTEAQVYSSAEAVKIGLADAVGTVADCVAAMRAENTDASEPLPEEREMTDTTITPEAHASAVEAARAEGVVAGTTAERARISGILSNEAAVGKTSAAMTAALETDMSVEVAVKMLGKMPEEAATATTFGADMTSTKNPNLSSTVDGKTDDEQDDEGKALVSAAVGMRGARKQ